MKTMKIGEALQRIRQVEIPTGAPKVFKTAACALAQQTGAQVSEALQDAQPTIAGLFRIWGHESPRLRSNKDARGVELILRADGAGRLRTGDTRYLYAAVRYLLAVLADREVRTTGCHFRLMPAFLWNRPCYDLFLTQEGRIQYGLNPETYVRRLAECGFTHLEVNGLASPMGLESGPKGEVYPMFYTYCPALDQFVHSRLNKGLYPFYYLSANLTCLKRNADLARKYGLVPGLLCFEPRTVPEEFFARYPMLRGARVDHPFRSFRPRYTMTITHPLVREHYAEMITNLLSEVPELGYLTIWTNDSGSGFEHTKSLYVGRNGGPYMIREWKDDAEIARVSAEWALTFFRLLRDTARKINPDFRVITRMESFYGEHDTIWQGLGDGLDVEAASLMARGWEMPYRHPRYPDSNQINGGTVYQLQFAPRETSLMRELETRDAGAHFYFAAGPHQMFAPLMGIPYPFLAHRRLKLLRDNGVRRLSHMGGTFPPELVPWNINHEVLARFQFDPDISIRREVAAIARRWAGRKLAPVLVRAWRLTEKAILAFPNVSTLYSTIGFTWYRLWVRPLVPNIEAIPREERAYYEDFMCTTPHNPNNVDLSRDVLFRLTTEEKSRLDIERMDEQVLPPLDAAIRLLSSVAPNTASIPAGSNAVTDQLVRLKALRCWFTTQRNVAAWVAGVYGWMAAGRARDKRKARALLTDMMRREILNTKELQQLFDTGVEFMATTHLGETPLMHGRNLQELLHRRIALMVRHFDDEPFIDHEFMMRMAGRPLA